MPSVIIHFQNEDPVVGEIDQMPGVSDLLIQVKNPRRKDGKDLNYLDTSVTTVLWPLSRISFIEVLPGEGEEKIITHVRE